MWHGVCFGFCGDYALALVVYGFAVVCGGVLGFLARGLHMIMASGD